MTFFPLKTIILLQILGARDWMQSFIHARQMLIHWLYSKSLNILEVFYLCCFVTFLIQPLHSVLERTMDEYPGIEFRTHACEVCALALWAISLALYLNDLFYGVDCLVDPPMFLSDKHKGKNQKIGLMFWIPWTNLRLEHMKSMVCSVLYACRKYQEGEKLFMCQKLSI